jgi:hypothetical protein
MIVLYGSQQDYDALTGKAVPGKPAWGPADFAAAQDRALSTGSASARALGQDRRCRAFPARRSFHP